VTPAVRIAGALICVSLVAAASAVAAPRLHRTKLPPPPPLPTSLAVDETEWKVVPSKTVVAAGQVSLRVYNRGMDDHDLTLVDSTGTTRQVYLPPGDTKIVHATLAPGLYRIYCSLFAGSPASHEALGMVSYLRVRADPAVRTTARGSTAR
jgi:hypothetical protein